MRHRISLHLTGSSAAGLVAAARACEDAGVHSLIASELYTNPFVPLAAVAASTSRIGLGTGIALAFVRSPVALALEALDLDALTSGRFTLGLGTGVKTLNEQWHGVTNFGPPVPHMREVVEFFRLFNAKAHLGQPIHYDGKFVKVHMEGYQRPYPPERERIPVHLGANREKMLELAGEVADGVLGHVFVSPRQLRDEVLPAVTRGLARARSSAWRRASPAPSTATEPRRGSTRAGRWRSTRRCAPTSRSSQPTGSALRWPPFARRSTAATRSAQ
jgi:alkanesulfonate monooxygenase SsuD/methylene tetrahydromethanopterin reductase-like flavin-dependent oxidoreductase (luciferase family)